MMGKKGIGREKMEKMLSAIKCGALRQNLAGEGKYLDGLDFSRLIHARIERPWPGA
jgi:hypothetical protein